MLRRDLHEANRLSWNLATGAHNSHKRDQAGFLRRGGSTLFSEERDLLGDVAGASLLYLQCNAGQDTLSLVRLGAAATGVDISDTAIAFAQSLSRDSGLPATFVRADVYDYLAHATDRFDLVFSSYGATIWLSDLNDWARGIARVLRPGGRFVLVEFHPAWGMLGDDWRPAYDYMGGGCTMFDEGIGDYGAMAGEALAPSGYDTGLEDFDNPHPTHEFCWGVADLVGALATAGLALERLLEYPYSNGFRRTPDMVALPGNRYGVPEGFPVMPLMLGIAAAKPR